MQEKFVVEGNMQESKVQKEFVTESNMQESGLQKTDEQQKFVKKDSYTQDSFFSLFFKLNKKFMKKLFDVQENIEFNEEFWEKLFDSEKTLETVEINNIVEKCVNYKYLDDILKSFIKKIKKLVSIDSQNLRFFNKIGKRFNLYKITQKRVDGFYYFLEIDENGHIFYKTDDSEDSLKDFILLNTVSCFDYSFFKEKENGISVLFLNLVYSYICIYLAFILPNKNIIPPHEQIFNFLCHFLENKGKLLIERNNIEEINRSLLTYIKMYF